MFEQIVKLNNDLWTLPTGVLIFVSSIGLGYLLKGVQMFNNKYIPLVLCFLGPIGYVLLNLPGAPAEGRELISWGARSVIVGFMISLIAWAFHAFWLKKYENQIPGLKEWIAHGSDNPPADKP